MREPSVVAVDVRTDTVLAVGAQAKDMIGRGTAYGRRLCFTSLVTEHPRASLKRFGKRYKEKRRLN